MPFFVPALLAGISALSGGLANRKQTTQQNSSSTTNSSSSTNPNYDEKTGEIRDFLLNQLMSGVETTPDMQEAYLSNGIANINKGADSTSNNIRQAMISRGLGRTSAGLAPEIANENARFGQLSQFQNNAPLVQEELRRKRLLDLSQFFATLPVGSNTTGTSSTNSTGTNPNPGNVAGGALSGGSQMAAFLYGRGAFQGGK